MSFSSWFSLSNWKLPLVTFHYEKKSTFSDFRQNSTTALLYRLSGISNPQHFLRYLFSFSRYSENIGFKIFLNSANFLILNYAIFTVLKELILRNSNLFEFFPYLTPLKSYLKNKYSIFNSAHNILDFFCTNFDHCTQIGVEWAIMKIN